MRSQIQVHIPIFQHAPNKVVPKLNVFIPRVNNYIFCEAYDASVVTSDQDNSKIKTVINELFFHPDNLSATTTYNNVFCLSCG